ncbi:MAG: RodZ domain-containing protein [Leucothrix sp.]
MAAEQSIESTEIVDVAPGDLTAIFRRYREERGLNISQVAEALCLSPKIITALETEQLDQLPEPPYVRGYLRSYAKFAEVDPSPLISAYEKLRGAKPNELDYHFTATPSAARNKRGGLSSSVLRVGLIVLLLGLLAILSMIPGVRDWAGNTWNKFSQESNSGFTNENSTDNPLLTSSIPTPLPIGDPTPPDGTTPIEGDAAAASGPAVLTSDGNVSFPSVDGGAVTTEGAAETDVPPGTPEENAPETAQTDTDSEAVPEGSSRLKMTFNDEVWMRIRDKEKKKLFEALSQKGNTKEMVLPRPMVIRVGNAQQLELTVDGKPFDLSPFIRGSVANFTIE